MELLNKIKKELLKYYKGLSYEIISVDKDSFVIVIEDSLLLYVGYDNSYDETIKSYDTVIIQELTYNNIIKFNQTEFNKKIDDDIFIDYVKYQGLNSYSYPYQKEVMDKVDKLCPNLRLKDRYNQWNGIHYNVVLLQMEDIDSNYEYLVYITKIKPHLAAQKIAKQLQEKSKGELTNNGFSSEPHFIFMKGNFCRGFDFIDAFYSHKRMRVKERLEKKFKYTFITTFLKEWRAHDDYGKKLLDNLYSNGNTYEWTNYIFPTTRWKNEEIVTRTIEKHYKDFIVIPQHRPYWLKSSFGGQMSYDVYISNLKIAIEYQGKQHFQPVNYFGGNESYEKVKIRDEEKRQLSVEHGIKLVYINYWDDLTENLIVKKINDAINEKADKEKV